MAIFSYMMGERVSRGAGRSAVKVAAYQARENYTDARTGYAYNHCPKEHPDQAPASEAKPAGLTRGGIAAASAYIGREAGYDEGRKPALFVGLLPHGAPRTGAAAARTSSSSEAGPSSPRRGRTRISPSGSSLRCRTN
jgi:hypothetical protein